MLRFIYGIEPDSLSRKEYGRVEASMEDLKGQLLYNVKLFATADKYDVPTFRSRIVTRARICLLNLPKEDYGSSEFLEALRDTSTYVGDHSLQDCLFQFCAERMLELTNISDFKEMLKESPTLSVRLLVFAMDRLRNVSTMWCCINCEEVRYGPGQCTSEDCAGGRMEERRLWFDG